jgi:hypothetical protein
MATYGDKGYYPGDDYNDDRGTSDDFYAPAATEPAKRSGGSSGSNPHRIKSFGSYTPVTSRNENFSAGATKDSPGAKWARPSTLSGAPNAVSLSKKEAWDQRQDDAGNLAADKMVHEQAQATAPKPTTQAQRRQAQKGRTFRPEDRQGTEYAERAARAKARDKKD